MKLRGFAGLAVLLLGATTLLTGCDDKITDALGELADAAPAELKTPLKTMHQIYRDVASGKTKTSDTEEMSPPPP